MKREEGGGRSGCGWKEREGDFGRQLGAGSRSEKKVKKSPKASKEICKTKIRKGKKNDTALDRMVSPAPQKVTQVPGCRDPIFFFFLKAYLRHNKRK